MWYRNFHVIHRYEFQVALLLVQFVDFSFYSKPYKYVYHIIEMLSDAYTKMYTSEFKSLQVAMQLLFTSSFVRFFVVVVVYLSCSVWRFFPSFPKFVCLAGKYHYYISSLISAASPAYYGWSVGFCEKKPLHESANKYSFKSEFLSHLL